MSRRTEADLGVLLELRDEEIKRLREALFAINVQCASLEVRLKAAEEALEVMNEVGKCS